MRRRLQALLCTTATLLALGVPGTAASQAGGVGISTVCVGPDCDLVRFFIQAPPAQGLELNTFSISLLNDSWRFTAPSPAAPETGTYSGQDALFLELGLPRGGFSTIADGGRSLFIDFTGEFFPFTLGAGERGFIEVDAQNTLGATTTESLAFRYEAMLADESIISGPDGPVTVTPEPVSMALLGTGLVGVGALRRRRRRTAA